MSTTPTVSETDLNVFGMTSAQANELAAIDCAKVKGWSKLTPEQQAAEVRKQADRTLAANGHFTTGKLGSRSVGQAATFKVDASDGKWVVVCETHFTLVNVGSRIQAERTSTTEFCDDCRGTDRVHNLEAAAAEAPVAVQEPIGTLSVKDVKEALRNAGLIVVTTPAKLRNDSRVFDVKAPTLGERAEVTLVLKDSGWTVTREGKARLSLGPVA